MLQLNKQTNRLNNNNNNAPPEPDHNQDHVPDALKWSSLPLHLNLIMNSQQDPMLTHLTTALMDLTILYMLPITDLTKERPRLAMQTQSNCQLVRPMRL